MLYHRYPNERQKYAILAINLRLVRLHKSIETFDRMQKNFQKGFSLILTREDLIFKPLQVQFDLEIQYIGNYLTLLNELRTRISYLDRFRRKSLLKSDLQEEKMVDMEVILWEMEKQLREIIYKTGPGLFAQCRNRRHP